MSAYKISVPDISFWRRMLRSIIRGLIIFPLVMFAAFINNEPVWPFIAVGTIFFSYYMLGEIWLNRRYIIEVSLNPTTKVILIEYRSWNRLKKMQLFVDKKVHIYLGWEQFFLGRSRNSKLIIINNRKRILTQPEVSWWDKKKFDEIEEKFKILRAYQYV